MDIEALIGHIWNATQIKEYQNIFDRPTSQKRFESPLKHLPKFLADSTFLFPFIYYLTVIMLTLMMRQLGLETLMALNTNVSSNWNLVPYFQHILNTFK